ncbi:MAG: hypothetical protein WBG92_07560 [Thiohalocapsa sp.]
MRDTIRVLSAMLAVSTYSSTLHADPYHGDGLPPGLQKKYERGETLPPGWRNKSSTYEDGYSDSYENQYEPEYFEDKVIRIIKNVRDLTGTMSQ